MSRRLCEWIQRQQRLINRVSLIWFYVHNVYVELVFRHLLRGSGGGNSRQHSVGDCLAARSRRQQELIVRLPRSVSYRRPRLPALWPNSAQVPLLWQLVLCVLCDNDSHRSYPWTSACSRFLNGTANCHSSPITGIIRLYTVVKKLPHLTNLITPVSDNAQKCFMYQNVNF